MKRRCLYICNPLQFSVTNCCVLERKLVQIMLKHQAQLAKQTLKAKVLSHSKKQENRYTG